MTSRIVLIGYGETGRVVHAALSDERGLPVPAMTVVDSHVKGVELARAAGVDVVLGAGWRLDTLHAAAVEKADCVIITVADDAQAVRITSVARSVNEDATIVTVVRNRDVRGLIASMGADYVIGTEEVVRWFSDLTGWCDDDEFDLPTRAQTADRELFVVEREVHDQEVGVSPAECGSRLLAVLRDGIRMWPEDGEVARLRHGDRLVLLRGSNATGE